jgi:hypothetical protein
MMINLNLITNVNVKVVSTPDTDFLKEDTEKTQDHSYQIR